MVSWDCAGSSGVKNLPANIGDGGLIPGSGNGHLLQILAWRSPPIEQPGRLQSMGLQRVREDWKIKQQHQGQLTSHLTFLKHQFIYQPLFPIQLYLFLLTDSKQWSLYWKQSFSSWKNTKVILKTFFIWFLIQFSSVQSLSRVWLFATPWTATRQASLSITNSRFWIKFLFCIEQGKANYFVLVLWYIGSERFLLVMRDVKRK